MGRHKEGEPRISPRDRIYNVPPERRKEAFRLRTTILQVFTELKQEGKLSPLNDREARKAAKMSPAELLRRLKDYPILQTYVLETMTDEEYEQYVDSIRNPLELVKRVKQFFRGFWVKATLR